MIKKFIFSLKLFLKNRSSSSCVLENVVVASRRAVLLCHLAKKDSGGDASGASLK